jgi:hypothetical protein
MCCIYYRDGKQGGKLGSYKKKKKAAAVKDDDAKNNPPADETTMSITGDVDALDGMTYVPYEKPQETNTTKQLLQQRKSHQMILFDCHR